MSSLMALGDCARCDRAKRALQPNLGRAAVCQIDTHAVSIGGLERGRTGLRSQVTDGNAQVIIGKRSITHRNRWWSMRIFRIRNELMEWLVILAAVTIAALLGAGVKSWLDNVLLDTNSGWLSGVAALIVFTIVAVPAYIWVDRATKDRDRLPAGDE